jgi:hypothetical protein
MSNATYLPKQNFLLYLSTKVDIDEQFYNIW